MGFYAILDQVMDLLRRRGRVTYRALQREFRLDEDTLTDLKDEGVSELWSCYPLTEEETHQME